MSIYNKSLQHVMKQKDKRAMVYGWMHSEGVIHGSNIMDSLSKAELRKVRARTFGAGGYMFDQVKMQHYGNRHSANWWLFKEDFVPGLAAGNYVRNKNIIWKEVPESYVHGFPTYVRYHILYISKKYFNDNAKRILEK